MFSYMIKLKINRIITVENLELLCQFLERRKRKVPFIA